MTKTDTCPFCQIAAERILAANEHGMAFQDSFPISRGHSLIIPRQHVASIYELTALEQASLWQLAAQVRDQLAKELKPDGFNIGLNDGAAAGQTINHAHIHMIPRYKGDVADPRGGIRWILPSKAKYWKDPA